MLVRTYCGAIQGIGALKITIEVFITQGIRFFIVGLADHAIRESQQRIESALLNTGFQWPRFRMVINLSPAHLRKEGSHFDLSLAIGILAASGQLETFRIEEYLLLGELSLDGGLRPVRGVLSMALMARDEGLKGVIVPRENLAEALVVDGLESLGASCLTEVVAFFRGEEGALMVDKGTVNGSELGQGSFRPVEDFAEVRGHERLKRAMLIVAAGSHNALMNGPPGSGKSMLARRLPGIMPPMELAEALECTQVYSIAGLLGKRNLLQSRPFRSPHHTSSAIAISGGGSSPRPGELSLAHNGVLFLDELPEFRRNVLEVLRQPMEEGMVHVSRANYQLSYPTRFILLAAMNPCPCGYYKSGIRDCQCSRGSIDAYRSRISGPLLDRIDLQLEVRPPDFSKLNDRRVQVSSKSLLDQVLAAKQYQSCKGRESGPDSAGASCLRAAMERFGLSARAYKRIIMVARTIADLEESGSIREAHVAEAISYREFERPE